MSKKKFTRGRPNSILSLILSVRKLIFANSAVLIDPTKETFFRTWPRFSHINSHQCSRRPSSPGRPTSRACSSNPGPACQRRTPAQTLRNGEPCQPCHSWRSTRRFRARWLWCNRPRQLWIKNRSGTLSICHIRRVFTSVNVAPLVRVRSEHDGEVSVIPRWHQDAWSLFRERTK